MSQLTFNELPEAVTRLIQQVTNIEQLLKSKTNESPKDEDRFLNVEEAGVLVKKAKATIYGLVSAGKIPHMKQGKQLYFSKRMLTEWIHAGKREMEPAIEQVVDLALNNANRKKRRA